MHLTEFYQEYGRIIDIAATLLGGGIVVRVYHWIKNKGKREVAIDDHLEELNKTSKELNQKIEDQRKRIDELREMATENKEAHEKIDMQIKQLQEYKQDTKENTKAVVELSNQIEGLIRQMEKNNGD